MARSGVHSWTYEAGARSRWRMWMKRILSLTQVILPILLLSALAGGCAGDAQGSSKASSGGDWTFLGNSYWYVPPSNLEAIFSSTSNGGTFIPITDQTVSYIQTYQGGYFWGRVATMLTIDGQVRTASRWSVQ